MVFFLPWCFSVSLHTTPVRGAPTNVVREASLPCASTTFATLWRDATAALHGDSEQFLRFKNCSLSPFSQVLRRYLTRRLDFTVQNLPPRHRCYGRWPHE